jgi:transcriptional regulator with GAF, ATPase, and Fis domain
MKTAAEIDADIDACLASRSVCECAGVVGGEEIPLTAAKRRSATYFERCYLESVMKKAGGNVTEGARIAGLDRSNFRKLLQRHKIR